MTGAAAAQRFSRAMATLLVAFLICFFLLHAMPGDPADRLNSPAVPAEQAERNRRALGLDRPLGTQLLRTIGSYANGDLGVSFTRKRPVETVLADALPSTVLLGSTALLLAYGLGLPLAVLLVALPARWRRIADRGMLALAVMPRFWLGVMLIFVLHGLAGWFPASHTGPPGGGDWVDRLHHLVLPTLALGLPAACIVGRLQLAVMEGVLDSPHVRSARAAGGGGLRLFTQHVLRPCLGPAIALFALDLPVLVSGAIVVEMIFAWPGVGRLTAEAVLSADYPLALAASALSVTVVLLGRFAAEALARALDPRQAAVVEEGRK
jgi:peptide/nickel transport system permease protein